MKLPSPTVYTKTSFLIFCCLVLHLNVSAQTANKEYQITSPDQRIVVNVGLASNKPYYNIKLNGQQVIQKSRLGLIREDADFSKDLSMVSVSVPAVIRDSYTIMTAKRSINNYKANKRVFHLKNSKGELMDIIFQIANDGVVFRYYFPGKSGAPKKIKEEVTTFNLGTKAKGWLQPMSDAKTGWAKTNPSYEEYYQQGIPAGSPSPIKAGWVYPALFQTGDNWVLLTETFPQGDYCATRLKAASPGGEYAVGFPEAAEVFPGGVLNPESKLPWYTPWRVLAIGSLKTIMESTLGIDVAKPAVKSDLDFIKPGKSSWSWVLLQDKATIYDVQKQFIDYAADMHWQYCLIDALWDTQIGYDKIKELADYAKTKNIGLILWYNSAGSWNEAPQTPRDMLITHEARVKEFARLQQMGIKGIKVDFFGGDGQSFMQYYIDILRDAMEYKILVNFHGTTLPRGLQRTYPNLVTAEAIKGMEFATFTQANMDEQPVHCTTIPFVRNVFDPMDYTPMALYKVPNRIRKTTSAFELALSVIFQSGVQHFAETPEGMGHMTSYVKDFLRGLPDYWEDTKFIDGFPGKFVVLARKAGNKWYVAGLNGEKTEKALSIDLSFLKGYKGLLITDAKEALTFGEYHVTPSSTNTVKLQPNGGFVMVFEQ